MKYNTNQVTTGTNQNKLSLHIVKFHEGVGSHEVPQRNRRGNYKVIYQKSGLYPGNTTHDSFAKDFLMMKSVALLKNTDDRQFIEKAFKIVDENISSTDFDVTSLVRELNMSRTRVFLKFKKLLNKSAIVFINTIKIKKSIHLLLTTHKTITDICYEAGYNDPSYFSRVFKTMTGKTPTEFKMKQMAYNFPE